MAVPYAADGYILRLFENQGRGTIVDIVLSPCFKKTYLANINERTECDLLIKNGKVKV